MNSTCDLGDALTAGDVAAAGEQRKYKCSWCKEYFLLEECSVKRWKKDGSPGQLSCKGCNKVCTTLSGQSLQLQMLQGQDRVDFFQRAQFAASVDIP